MQTLDARGLSCPEPVVMIANALRSGEKSYRMIVDAAAPRENVTRYATHQGYKVKVSESGGEWTLDITK